MAAQHDFTIDNQTMPSARSDINSALQALASLSWGPTAPATTFAYMWWADSTTGLLKIRNAANSGWITVGTLATANFGLLLASAVSAAALTVLDDTTVGAMLVTLGALGQGKQTIWVPAPAMVSRTTNGAAIGTSEMTTNKNMLRTLDFDTTTQEFAQFTIAMPKSWNEGTVTFQPYWTAASGSGTVEWALQGVATSDDDAMDVAFGTEQLSGDTLITANDCHIGPESSAITIAGSLAAGDRVNFQMKRNPAGTDTLGVDAKLIGIKLFITLDAPNDA